MMQSVSEILGKAEQSVPRTGEYLTGDGLLHCRTCGEPVQCRVMFMGNRQQFQRIAG